MKYEQLYILGSGGHGKVAAEVAFIAVILRKIFFSMIIIKISNLIMT